MVTNTNDSGLGSLRQAILDANAASNLNYIHFDIGSSCGPRIINLASPLPQITQSVVIDGYTNRAAHAIPRLPATTRCFASW